MSAVCDNCRATIPGRRSTRSGPPWHDAFPVGQERGTQRDPEQTTIDLCGRCQECLGGMIGGPPTPIDLADFADRYLVGHGHFSCKPTTALLTELEDRGFAITITVDHEPGVGIATVCRLRAGGRSIVGEAVLGVDVAAAVSAAYYVARGDGWPEERS